MRHNAAVLCAAISPNGELIAASDQDGMIRIWDARTGQQLRGFLAHDKHARSVTFSPDGNRLITSSDDGTVRVWDARPWQEGEPGQEFLTLRGHESGVNGVAFGAQGRVLASACADGTVKLWDAWTGRELRTLRCGTEPGAECGCQPRRPAPGHGRT